MAENSKIEWTHHTFNPWWGCTKVSDGCKHCYAETFSKRTGANVWGPKNPRRRTSAANWREPIKWNAAAAAEGVRKRVFCASMADVFEGYDTMPEESRAAVLCARVDLVNLIYATPNLDWLLLSKRIELAQELWDEACSAAGIEGSAPFPWPDNVWLGTSCEDQRTAARRIPWLQRCRVRVRFLSLEPMLAEVNLSNLDCEANGDPEYIFVDCLQGTQNDMGRPCADVPKIHWVICGGESGAGARPMALGWAKDIVRQCKRARVPVFVKQLGANPTNREGERCPHIKHPKGADTSEWPEELRVREFPVAA